MKKTLSLILVALAIMFCVGACSSRQRQPAAGIPLPFDDEGNLIIHLPISDEYGSIGFFGVGGLIYWYTPSTIVLAYYRAFNFHSYAAEFLSLMDSITPVFVDARTLHTSDVADSDISPFRAVAHGDLRYLWQLWRTDYRMRDVRMHLYQVGDLGYMRFSQFDWERQEEAPYSLVIRDNVIHYTLYRISPGDLARFSEFADGLLIGMEIMHGHFFLPRYFMNGVTIAGVIGVLLVIWGIFIFLANHGYTPNVSIGAFVGEEINADYVVALRRYYAKIVYIPVGLLTALCALGWRLYGLRLYSYWLAWELLFCGTGVYFVIVVGLVVFALAYLIYKKLPFEAD